MTDEARSLIIRECRNLILNTLRTVYPASLKGETLYRVILGSMPEYNRTFCFKDLYYLEDKRYVQRKNALGKVDRVTDWKEAKWSLTATGNEIANDLVDDPALEV